MLIGVSGKAHAGKDEIAKILVRDHGYKQKALATKMKEAALKLDPWIPVYDPGAPMHLMGNPRWMRLSELIAAVGPEEAKKNPEVRRTYQRMGTEVGRNTLDPELWVKLCIGPLRASYDYVISDVRFLNELTAIQKRYGVVWRVIRPDNEGLEGEAAKHISEWELHDETSLFDAIIVNDGTLEDLAKKVADACADAALDEQGDGQPKGKGPWTY